MMTSSFSDVTQTDILTLLNISGDDSFFIDHIDTDGDTKFIHIYHTPGPVYCPKCIARMHSKGFYIRKVNHPILRGNVKLYLIVHQRKWHCPHCGLYMNESFPFLERYSHSSNMTPFLVINAMKDINLSAARAARQFNLSDTQVHDLFNSYVDLDRLPLPEYISIDEVFLNTGDKDKYAFVIMDFVTGDIIDIVHNRWMSTLEEYFLAIPLEERKRVKGVICDAYRNYQLIPEKFFPNACTILDSFHVIKIIIERLNTYIYKVMKRYQERDKKRMEEKNHDTNSDHKTIKDSQEVVLLKNYRWVLLKNRDEINYSTKRYYHKRLGMVVDTFTIEKMFLDLDPNFRELRDLKEAYIQFNNQHYSEEEQARKALDDLIMKYEKCNQSIFNYFSAFLKSSKELILNSFTETKVHRKSARQETEYYSRLSNGPMESFNRKPKDYKRLARGFSDFHYTRNRILWSMRENAPIRGIPKEKSEYKKKGRKRGPYKSKSSVE